MPTPTFQEKKEQIKNGIVAEIATSIKSGNAPFLHYQQAEKMQRAYNPSNGIPYEGLNSLMLDIKKNEGKYPTNSWISLSNAEFLGAKPEEIQNMKEHWKEKSATIHFVQTTKIENVYKLDANNQKIPLLDENGNQRIGRDNKPLYQFEMIPQVDKNGNPKINPKTNEPYMEVKTQRVALNEPILKTELLYNIAEFPSIKKERLKELNVELEQKHILKHTQDFKNEHQNSKIVFEDIKDKLFPQTAEQIKEYFNAQSFKKDYQPPKGLNEKQKQEVAKYTKEAIQESKKQDKTQKQEATKANVKEPAKKTASKGRR